MSNSGQLDLPCPLTTAVLDYFGNPAQPRRNMQRITEEFIWSDPWRSAEVASYYEIAPELIQKLDQDPYRDQIYAVMRRNYIDPAAAHAEREDFEAAYVIYKAGLAFLHALLT